MQGLNTATATPCLIDAPSTYPVLIAVYRNSQDTGQPFWLSFPVEPSDVCVV